MGSVLGIICLIQEINKRVSPNTMLLKCNNLKCRSEIQKNTLITACSHIFCQKCSPQIKRTMMCIACKSYVKEDEMIVKELDVPCLIGYSPEEIFESVQKAISFWLYQNDQEFVILQTYKEKAEDECFKYKQELKSFRASTTVETESLNKKIDKIERSLERERQNSYDLSVMLSEKTKQYQKLLNNSEKIKYKNGMMSNNLKNVIQDEEEN